ncbi:hypothetical protein Tco_0622021 [Tanacetum coccineum]
MRGCTILWVLPQSISTVTGYVLMKPVIGKVWEDDIPKYVVADKDHNCGIGVSSCGTGSFGAESKVPYFRPLLEGLSCTVFVNGNGFGGCEVGLVLGWNRGFVPSNDGSRIFGGLGLCEYDEEGDSLCFGKFMCGVLLGSVVRVSERLVMWVTKFAVVAVWASILVVKDLVASIKAAQLVDKWKAPNDGTTMRLGEERKKGPFHVPLNLSVMSSSAWHSSSNTSEVSETEDQSNGKARERGDQREGLKIDGRIEIRSFVRNKVPIGRTCGWIESYALKFFKSEFMDKPSAKRRRNAISQSQLCSPLRSFRTALWASLKAKIGLAIPDGQVRQANHACYVKPSLNGNENSTASNYLNLRRIREQRLLSAAVAARILKLSASGNHTAFSRPNTQTYYTKKERQALSLKLDYPSDSSPAELTSRWGKEEAVIGKALKSEVWRLKEEMFLVDAGLATARMSMQDEPKGVPINRATRF